ncbi:cell wall-binding repeat-containing protein [Clostridium sp. OS1-26]|uniref:cell wall-binding repeat-containing protein n=1 Tax=Clostridium sp. OS1-26 TaxID=3070681 RepID=UPI0027E18288|nr:cell wall-binding repeat-containing protein [Clostridium sp. OS1-26]WML36191.1 cell wall-binding repeat-containing protein [Clostridium sp. OS1-26]
MKRILILITAGILLIGNFHIVHAESNYNVIRISGNDRYQTSLNIANNFFNDDSKNIIIANGENFPDAIAGSILSEKLDAPILLVNKNLEEDKNLRNRIDKITGGCANIYILGGDASISNNYEKIAFQKTIRLSGSDRFSTNSAIINYVNVKKGTPVIIVNGYEFADALSVSSISAIKGYPVIMTAGDKLNDNAAEMLKNIEPSQIFIIGGQGAISDNVVNNINNTIKGLNNSKITRISGADRYETSLNVAKYFNLNGNTAIIASGEDFPDALSGSALAAKLNAPVILTNGKDISAQKSYLDTTSYKKLILLGGESSISTDVENKLTEVPNTIVTFSDKNLEAVIRKSINKPNGDIYTNDIKNILVLDASFSSISDLSDIGNLTNLRELNLSNNNITSIEPLKNMINLKDLNLSSNEIRDISVLKNLVNLEELNLNSDSELNDMSPIGSLYNLTSINLSNTRIKNLSILSNLNKLTNLRLDNNGLTDIGILKNLDNLEYLSLLGNQINNIDVLTEFNKLQHLTLSENKIKDIEAIKNLTSLNELYLAYNEINDITSLKGLTNLKILYLQENKIKDVSPLKQLTNLSQVVMDYNEITDSNAEQLKKLLPNCNVIIIK